MLSMGNSTINGPFSIAMLVPNAAPRQLVMKSFSCFFKVWGGGDVNVPVNFLTSCMLRELRGLGGGGVKVPVNWLTSCMLRELRGLGGVGGCLTSL